MKGENEMEEHICKKCIHGLYKEFREEVGGPTKKFSTYCGFSEEYLGQFQVLSCTQLKDVSPKVQEKETNIFRKVKENG